jgi:hypothetical protein
MAGKGVQPKMREAVRERSRVTLPASAGPGTPDRITELTDAFADPDGVQRVAQSMRDGILDVKTMHIDDFNVDPAKMADAIARSGRDTSELPGAVKAAFETAAATLTATSPEHQRQIDVARFNASYNATAKVADVSQLGVDVRTGNLNPGPPATPGGPATPGNPVRLETVIRQSPVSAAVHLQTQINAAPATGNDVTETFARTLTKADLDKALKDHDASTNAAERARLKEAVGFMKTAVEKEATKATATNEVKALAREADLTHRYMA